MPTATFDESGTYHGADIVCLTCGAVIAGHLKAVHADWHDH